MESKVAERIVLGAVIAGLLATSAWFWHQRAAAIRERDFAGRRINLQCNQMSDMYRSAMTLAENAKTGQRRIGGVDFAPVEAAGLAARLVEHSLWLELCSTDAEQADELTLELGTRLQGLVHPGRVPLLDNDPAGIPDVVEQLRRLVPMRDIDDRAWVRARRDR